VSAEPVSAHPEPQTAPSGPEVVYLFNGMPVPVPGTVSKNLVKWLEDMLERARSGEIVGMVAAYEYPSVAGTIRPAGYSVVGYVDSYSIVGAIETAKYGMLQRMVSD